MKPFLLRIWGQAEGAGSEAGPPAEQGQTELEAFEDAAEVAVEEVEPAPTPAPPPNPEQLKAEVRLQVCNLHSPSLFHQML